MESSQVPHAKASCSPWASSVSATTVVDREATPPRSIHPVLLGTLRRLAPIVALSALLPTAAHPCSTIHPGISSLHLGSDGLLHWQAWAPTGVRGGAYWLSEGGVEPGIVEAATPSIREGQQTLLHVLPDGSSWWNVYCSEREAPKTATCDSLVWVDAEGRPLGRVAAGLWGPKTFHADGTIELLQLREEPEAAAARDKHDRRPTAHLLELWHATPQPLASFEDPLPAGRWNHDYKIRAQRARSDGWSRAWSIDFPRALDRFGGTQFTRRGDLLATVNRHREDSQQRGGRGELRVTVWDLDPSSQSAPLKPRWDRVFARASDGRTRTPDGEFALAEAGFLALDAKGRLAMGGWQTNPDCSQDRPEGFVVFDVDGTVMAEVETSKADDMERLAGLAFDADGDIVAFGRGDIGGRYDTDGRRLGDVRTRPSVWREKQEDFNAMVDGLDAQSSLQDWTRALPVLVYQLFQPETKAKLQTAERVLLRDWPAMDAGLNDQVRVHFAPALCQAFPDAAPTSFLRRFEEADEQTRRAWIEVLPDCVAEPPPAVRAYVDELLASRDSDQRRLGEQVSARWPVAPDAVERLWRVARSGLGSTDSTARREAVQAARSLLAMAPQLAEDFESKLNGEHRGQTALVLLLAFVHIDQPQWVPEELRPARQAILRWSAKWVRSEDEFHRALGTILSIGLGPDDADRPDAHQIADLDALHSENWWPWAAIAFGRALERSTVKTPETGWRRTQPHDPGEAGLPQDIALHLLERLLQRPILHWRRGENGQRDLAEPPEHPVHLLAEGALHQAETALALSLGTDAKIALRARIEELAEGQERDVHLRQRADQLLGVAIQQFDAAPALWNAEDITWLLDHPRRFGSHEVWRLAARALPDEHPLRERVEGEYLALLDAAKRADPDASRDPRAAFRSPAAQFARLLSDLINATVAAGSSPSPLIDLVEPSDLEAVAFANAAPEERRSGRIDLDGWLYALAEIGPWPGAIPELERRLDGQRPFRAALALSHLEHARALETLVTTREGFGNEVDRALARYGDRAVDRLAEEALGRFRAIADVSDDAADPSAGMSSNDRLLLHYELAQALGRLARRLHGIAESGSAAPSSPRLDAVERWSLTRVRADLEAGKWPPAAAVILLDILGHDAFAWVVDAEPNLPGDRGLSGFFGGVDSDLLYLRLEGAARRFDEVQRDRLEALLSPLVHEWGDQVRWLLHQLRSIERDERTATQLDRR